MDGSCEEGDEGIALSLLKISLYFLLLLCTLSVLWIGYNAIFLILGSKPPPNKRRGNHRAESGGLPSFSIIIPARDEEVVIKRVLKALLQQDYPLSKMQIIVVDSSNDKTPEICKRYMERFSRTIKMVRQSKPTGKASALNLAFKYITGEIIGVFDADSIPSPDALKRAASRFSDPKVVAIQGSISSINADQNHLTKMIAYEEAIWFGAYLRAKDRLGLFVPFAGTCEFVRSDVLERMGGWDEKSLGEDVEMAARLGIQGYSVKYAPEVFEFQEAPSITSQLIKQRTRWFRGCLQNLSKHFKALLRPKMVYLDVLMLLMGPLIILSNFISIVSSMAIAMRGNLQGTIRLFLLGYSTTFLLIPLVIALFICVRARSRRGLYWIPFVYWYWFLNVLTSTLALVQFVTRRPSKWEKTEKSGLISDRLAPSWIPNPDHRYV